MCDFLSQVSHLVFEQMFIYLCTWPVIFFFFFLVGRLSRMRAIFLPSSVVDFHGEQLEKEDSDIPVPAEH